ncbi:MAG: EamA family transporter [Verrucomicrobiales bacterium]|nr:EamA family transporter [Verrucomicrobiales bacterium]
MQASRVDWSTWPSAEAAGVGASLGPWTHPPTDTSQSPKAKPVHCRKKNRRRPITLARSYPAWPSAASRQISRGTPLFPTVVAVGYRTTPTIALVFGALAIGFAPVFAAFALKPEYGGFGPAAIGFYRVFFALPFLWLVLLAAPGKAKQPKRIRRPTGLLALAGFFFAIDLVSWHWSIKYTTVANATLLANFAPLWVMLWAGRLFGERITPRFLGALGLAIVGAAVLMNASFRLSPTQLFGDALSLLTAISYGSYMLTVKKLRETCPPQEIMAWSGLFAVPLMLVAALATGETMATTQLNGWLVLLGLALISHFAGQGLIAYAFGHLPAALTSLNLLLQPVFAAALGWVLLNEALGGQQLLGAAIVLGALFAANRPAEAK